MPLDMTFLVMRTLSTLLIELGSQILRPLRTIGVEMHEIISADDTVTLSSLLFCTSRAT